MREKILTDIQKSLAQAQSLPPLPRVTPLAPLPQPDPEKLLAQFAEEWAKLSGTYVNVKRAEALQWTLEFLRERQVQHVLSWDDKFLPLTGWPQALSQAKVVLTETGVAAEVGLTGVEAACADVGCLVLAHGAGRSRMASLMVPIHIAFFTPVQVVPSLASWWGRFNPNVSHTVVIAGPSRTSDIERILVLGAHGPKEAIAVCVE